MPRQKARIDRTKGEQFDSLWAMARESERACPLIAVEYLNESLYGLLRTQFDAVGLKRGVQDSLLNSVSAPLGTFGMRTRMCRAFGIMPADICDLLDAIREIRNYCGHTQGIVSLNDPDIRGWVHAVKRFVDSEKKGGISFQQDICAATHLLGTKIAVLRHRINQKALRAQQRDKQRAARPTKGRPKRR